MLWIACELAIIACDLAEVIGTAIALQLLFGIPLIGGAMLTALDAFLVLLLMNRGFRYLEAFVIALLIIIFGCFAIQIFVAAPPAGAILHAMFVPSPRDRHQPGDALHRHRHHRRHRHAAQSLPALLHRADPRL